jgi:hypothetical protein
MCVFTTVKLEFYGQKLVFFYNTQAINWLKEFFYNGAVANGLKLLIN